MGSLAVVVVAAVGSSLALSLLLRTRSDRVAGGDWWAHNHRGAENASEMMQATRAAERSRILDAMVHELDIEDWCERQFSRGSRLWAS
jgi:hypothetical protein